MRSLLSYLECGKCYEYRESVSFLVTKHSDLVEKVIPFFDKYSILGVKAKDFSDFKLMKNKDHLTQEGLKKIGEIRIGMNTGRKFE